MCALRKAQIRVSVAPCRWQIRQKMLRLTVVDTNSNEYSFELCLQVYTHCASGLRPFVDIRHVRSRSKVLLIKQILSECVHDHLGHLTAQRQQLLI